MSINVVLLIDDDPDDQEIFRYAMQKVASSVRVLTCSSGEAALELLSRERPLPDLVLVDINMPGMTGFEFLRQFRRNSDFHHVPVAVYSTSVNPVDKRKALSLGATGYLVKPFGLTDLCQQLQDFFATFP
jgi:CheY-like chemotaxis protein